RIYSVRSCKSGFRQIQNKSQTPILQEAIIPDVQSAKLALRILYLGITCKASFALRREEISVCFSHLSELGFSGLRDKQDSQNVILQIRVQTDSK
ncbi:hypothetical protein QUF80_11050, partial [Desulfococcaceae bacterium HSG8]|nr:hypothetical protein [Desulfococcaceae bacterium HSG8]